jgi:hypothetical protein
VAYLAGLGSAPMHIGGDEAQFATHAHAVASTGHDPNGRFLPLFFNITDPLVHGTSAIWYQPMLFYLMAQPGLPTRDPSSVKHSRRKSITGSFTAIVQKADAQRETQKPECSGRPPVHGMAFCVQCRSRDRMTSRNRWL